VKETRIVLWVVGLRNRIDEKGQKDPPVRRCMRMLRRIRRPRNIPILTTPESGGLSQVQRGIGAGKRA
jgi:hypothetical protein